MKMMLFGLAICAGFVQLSTGSIVSTSSGLVSGWQSVSRGGRAYEAWTAVPFAAPPVGILRLKAPTDVPSWDGVLNTTRNAPRCSQLSGGTEDCLYLNIFRPHRNGSDSRKLPVLIFIHGGSFQSDDVGPRQSADYLMDEDVVLVQISYRLNGFGFMSLGDAVMPGNFGLKDQAQGLKWLKRNIEAFGGDPTSFTVFGGSAGGASTHYLLKSPLTEGFVTRAVSHSGTINHSWSMRNIKDVRNSTLRVARGVGCSEKSSLLILNCLQQVSSAALSLAIKREQALNPEVIPFVPVIEPKDAQGAFATEDLSLRPSFKPWLTSTVNGEYLLFKNMATLIPQSLFKNTSAHLEQFLKNELTNLRGNPEADSAARIVERLYFVNRAPVSKFIDHLAKMDMDTSFIYPGIYNIKMHKGPKWFSRMLYRGDLSGWNTVTRQRYPENVAGHDSEKFFYMNYRSSYPEAGPNESPEDYAVSKRLIRYLVNFAYHGDPTPPGSPTTWKQFTDGETLQITAQGDSLMEPSTYRTLLNIYNLWNYMAGWI